MESPRPVSCLYFGTFNPIHTGHLLIAQAVFTQFAEPLGLKNVLFIPANNPPHREGEPDMLPARQRHHMVRLATAGTPHFEVSDIELRREDRSFTIDTIRALIESGYAQAPVPMIIGADALAHLASWHEPAALAELVLFLQAPRPECPFVESIILHGQSIPLQTHPVTMPPLALSSTWVREMARQGHTEGLRFAVPEPVRAYIRDNRLYRNGQ